MTTPLSVTRVILFSLAVLSVVALAWTVVQIRSILFLLVLGIIFAAAIEPLVYRLRRAGLRRGQSILLVYAAILVILGGTIYLMVPHLVKQFDALDAAIPGMFDNLRQQALSSDHAMIRRTGYQTLLRIESTYLRIRNSPEINQDQAVVAATSVLGIFFTIVSLLIVAFYWMTERATIKRVMLGLIPLRQRARAHEIWDEIEYRIGGWTRGQLLLMFIIGISSGIAYWAMELPFWLALAIWAGITEAIPYIGPFIGGATAALVALTDSPEKALWVVIFAVVLQQVEGAVLVPRVMKNAVGMSPLTVVLAVLIGNALAGLVGSLLAIPIGAAIQVLVSNLLRGQDSRLSAELSTMDIAPLSPAQFSSPFTPLPRPIRRSQRTPEARADRSDAPVTKQDPIA
ncbi:MAG TPA: AI-2E family transporter [Thermomicrobiales bacterium]|nr:AI-2E family transporter [Thermomicrobiales bacterium]